MFHNFSFRLKGAVVFYIAVILILMMMTSYYTFSGVLRDNYIEKTQQFIRQETNNAETTVSYIEKTNESIVNELGLSDPQLYRVHHPEYIKNLWSYNSVYPYFGSFFVYYEGSTLYYYGDLKSYIADAETIIEGTHFNDSGVGWYTLDLTGFNSDAFILIRRIAAGEGNLYIFFQVDMSNVACHFVGDSRFVNYKALYIKAGDNAPICSPSKLMTEDWGKYIEDIGRLSEDKATVMADGSTLITRTGPENRGIVFYCVTDMGILSSYTRGLRVILIVAAMFVLAAAYYVISRLSVSMASQLDKIRSDMQNYL